MCCGIGTSDPPSGTIRQNFHIQLPTPIPGTQPVLQTWSGPIGTCSSNSTVPIVPTTTMCCGGIGTDPPSGTIRQDFHIQTTHTCPRDATSVADVVWGQFGTCSSNSTVPIVPPPPPCAAVGLALQIHPLHHKTRLTSKSTLIQGRIQCRRRGSGANSAHAAQILPFHTVPPPPPCATVVGTSDPPSGTIRQGFTSKLPHLPQGRNQCRRRGWGQSGTCSSNSTVPIPPPPPCAAVGLALQIHPLVP
jgi:hypothetical protein